MDLPAVPEKTLKSVAAKYHLTAEQAAGILRLLDEGCSTAYVMRYHKELAAGLSADAFHELMEEQKRVEKLEARRRKICKKLKERDILTDDLEAKINQAHDMRELIDYYVPFRPRKRSRSRQALAQGLEPLAAAVLSQEEFIPDMTVSAEPFVDPANGLESVEAVLEGVFHIVSDWVSEEKAHRDRLRRAVRQDATLVASRSAKSMPSRLVREFKTYFDYREKTSKLHPYHMLTILRGKRLRVLQYHIEPPLDAMARTAADLFLSGGASQYEQIVGELGVELSSEPAKLKALNGTEFLVVCVKYSLESILADITTREIDKELCKEAEELALEITRRNVRAMLMAKPLTRRTLGIHPGYRTGCQLAALDGKGDVLETATVYPHLPQREVEKAKEELIRLIDLHKIEVVAIGEGTGVQETEALIAELIAERFPELRYTVVSEIGVESYSTSRGGRSDLTSVKPDERCAVAVGRRVVDPLSELVKVNPRDLCPLPYVEDVNGGALKKLLERTIEDCVSQVGVELNAAHYSLLRYVSGIGPEKAIEVVDHRDKQGPFASRQQLRDVPKIDEPSYDRAVGFLKVEASENPLDVTRIHPRHYPIAEAICTQFEMTLADLRTPEGRQKVRERQGEIKLADLEKQFDVHYLLLKDIIDEMANPWPDPREGEQGPVLYQKKLVLTDLEPGQWFMGTVRSIVEFGVFVDINIGEDGLVHISELSDKYVQSPYDIVSVGDPVRVKVVRVDKEKGRIALSMRSEDSQRERPQREPRQRRPAAAHEAGARSTAETPSTRALPTSVRAPKSTLGWDSRRVQKASVPGPLSKTQQQILKKPEPAPAPAGGENEEKKAAPADVGGLLGRLGFGAIEKRGAQRDE